MASRITPSRHAASRMLRPGACGAGVQPQGATVAVETGMGQPARLGHQGQAGAYAIVLCVEPQGVQAFLQRVQRARLRAATGVWRRSDGLQRLREPRFARPAGESGRCIRHRRSAATKRPSRLRRITWRACASARASRLLRARSSHAGQMSRTSVFSRMREGRDASAQGRACAGVFHHSAGRAYAACRGSAVMHAAQQFDPQGDVVDQLRRIPCRASGSCATNPASRSCMPRWLSVSW